MTPTDSSKTDDTQGASKDPEQIEAEIAATREDLGRTVDELTDRLEETKDEVQAKLDVKGQAKAKLDSYKDQARTRRTDTTDRARTAVQDPQQRAELAAKVAPVLAGVGGIAVVIGLLRRRFHR